MIFKRASKIANLHQELKTTLYLSFASFGPIHRKLPLPKGAAHMWWNGSYADGLSSQSVSLLFTVMSSHINLSAINHSNMASDINWLANCVPALCAKALSNAYVNVENVYFHTKMLI